MTRHVESRLVSHLLNKLLHGRLLIDGRRHVDNRATRGADEVVMVSGDPLGEFEPNDAIGSVLRR